MSAAIESVPFFRSRATQIGISGADLDILKEKNLSTYGAFAFLAPYQANQDLNVLKDQLTAVLGA